MENFGKSNHRFGRLFLGITIGLAAILVAFEWRTISSVRTFAPGNSDDKFIPEQAPYYIIEKKKKEPEPVPQKQKTSSTLKISDEPLTLAKGIEEPELAEPVISPVPPKEEEIPSERDIFLPVEQMPQFPGGETELMKFLGSNINYPEVSKKMGITGVVYVEFIIGIDGTITNIKIAKGVSSDIDKEALRIVALMPKWIPGSQRNKVVPVGMRLPIKFRLI